MGEETVDKKFVAEILDEIADILELKKCWKHNTIVKLI